MEMPRYTKLLGLMATLSVISCASFAAEPLGLYTNGSWDAACAKCWPSPHTDSNNTCKPSDCAIHGYYHCKQQNPPLAIDDDPRLISLIHSGQCSYAPKEALNAGEASYVESMKLCTGVLDKMAGRFNLPANPADANKQKTEFYMTNFKAYVLGSANDQLKLAIAYDIGMGTAQNREHATELYNKAANNGIPFAQYAVGARYAYGIATPQDTKMAITWLHKALMNAPTNDADKKAQAMIAPCAMKLIEHLTPM